MDTTGEPIPKTMTEDDAQLHEVTEASIIHLVDTFYHDIRRHPLLGPIFNARIAPDAWAPHLEKMYAFWSSVMLTSGRYKGNPVAVHQQVGGITPELFGHWLDLFEATASRLFVPAIAEEFVVKARRIAESLRLALFFRPDAPWSGDVRDRASSSAKGI